jgi:hypothetical protein
VRLFRFFPSIGGSSLAIEDPGSGDLGSSLFYIEILFYHRGTENSENLFFILGGRFEKILN